MNERHIQDQINGIKTEIAEMKKERNEDLRGSNIITRILLLVNLLTLIGQVTILLQIK